MVEPLEYFELIKKTEATLSYIYMIIYIYQHKSDILNNIEYPIEYKNQDYLSLNSNCVRQLNVVSNYSYYKGKNESLYEICNICSTNMGKRLLKQRLLYPLIDAKKINERYNLIETIKNENLYDELSSKLTYISDLEKMLRTMGLNLLEPYDLFSANLSYEYVNCLLLIINENTNLKNVYKIDDKVKIKYKKFYKKLTETFNFQDVQNVPASQANKSLFNIGLYPDIDIIDQQIKQNIETLNCICKNLSKIIDSKNENCIKYCNDKNEQWYIYCTNKRAQTFKQNLKNISKSKLNIKRDKQTILQINKDDISYKKNDKSSTIIDIDEISDISKNLKNLYKKLSKLNVEYYNLEILKIYNENRDCLKTINQIIADIDFGCVGAKLSIQNNYCRPIIKQSDSSFVEFCDIRHPIVEKINKEVEYVVNDINIDKKNNGVLLFGTNACGKSTFMKAIGLNVIMAQAGLYVAASKLVYSPYKQIFTRILNNDNIFRSQSSFAVEIEELRSILKRCCDNSLVLGDELCSGTETKSALAIVSAGLYELSERNCNFIFTSHLHQLMDIDIVKNIETLNVYHLKILYENGKLIYDRKLEPGSGPPVYGLKVCEALGLPDNFLKMANKIQIDLENSKPKSSLYNKDVILDVCEICGDPAEETDHINEQKEADENGMIKHFHKNSKHNLVGLCKKCHQKKQMVF
jgi:DNA mismatch repair protein MutS